AYLARDEGNLLAAGTGHRPGPVGRRSGRRPVQTRTSWGTDPYTPSPAGANSYHSRANSSASQPRTRRSSAASASSSAASFAFEIVPLSLRDEWAARTKTG